MSVSVKKLPGEPIVIVTYTMPFKGKDDVNAANAGVADLITRVEGDLYRIADLSTVTIEWNELIRALQEATHRKEGTLRDSRVHSIFVGEDQGVVMAVNSLKQQQYGGIDAKWFATLNEALEYARNEIAR